MRKNGFVVIHLQRFRLEEDAIREVYPEYFEK